MMKLFERRSKVVSGAVIFGSVAKGGKICPRWDIIKPRDFNVAVYGDMSYDDAVIAAQHWAVDHRLPSGVPLRILRLHVDNNTIFLHTPIGIEGRILPLLGHTPKVFWHTVKTLPALLRLSATDQYAAYGRIAVMLRSRGLMIDLIQKRGEDWDVGGAGMCLRALANGLRHADENFLSKLGGLGYFLAELKALGEHLPDKVRSTNIDKIPFEHLGKQYIRCFFEQAALDAPVLAHMGLGAPRIPVEALFEHLFDAPKASRESKMHGVDVML